MTSCGFCQASRAGSSNTCAHFSALLKPCSCVAGDWAARGPATNRSKAAASLRGCRGSGVGSRLMAALTGGTMNGEKRIWSQHVANLARAAFWLLLLAILLLQLLGSRGQDSQRAALLGSFEKERNSRVIAMIHRQESASILGVPVAGSISIDDSEAILRAIRLTPPEQPIDVILHTPGGLVLAAEQIAKALLGPVDPQIGDMPAASIVKVVELKGPKGVSDEILILADMAQKARIQVASFVVQLLL